MAKNNNNDILFKLEQLLEYFKVTDTESEWPMITIDSGDGEYITGYVDSTLYVLLVNLYIDLYNINNNKE